jgi:hypothetical protein
MKPRVLSGSAWRGTSLAILLSEQAYAVAWHIGSVPAASLGPTRRRKTKMLTIAGALRAVDDFFQPAPVGPAVALHTPVQFDRALIRRLLHDHEALNARFAHLVCLIDTDVAAAVDAAGDCINRIHELRRSESTWLYPVIACGIDADPAARAQLMQLRLVMLTLARHAMRELENLVRAVREHDQPHAAAERASAPLAEYLRRSASEIYPLYDRMGARTAPAARAA